MKPFLLAAACSFLLSFACQAGEPDLKPLFAAMETKWPKNRTFNIVFHGHSVPSGYHKTPEVKPFESYPHLFLVKLKERYPHAVINVIVTAIGGEDSVAGAERFEKDVLSLRPDLVFIDFALNDRRKPLPAMEAAWLSMIDDAARNKVPVVLMTPTGDSSADLANPEDPLSQRAELIRRVSREKNAWLADVTAEWQAEIGRGTPQQQLLSQPNHPNLRGHQVALAAITRCLEETMANQ